MSNDTVRKRGSAAVRQRERRLAAEPLCRMCSSNGRITAATVPDHIVPIENGGSDEDSNIQCLCAECHRVKTAADRGYRQGTRFDQQGRVIW